VSSMKYLIRFALLSSACALMGAAASAVHAETRSLADVAQSPGSPEISLTERESKSHHNINLGGRTLHYEANAGSLITRDDVGNPQQSIFFVAYRLEGVPAGAPRPVMFLFNGGPGTAAIFLHMASFGPMRVETTATGFLPPAPFAFAPNPDTLLDVADLVFIDPPNAGYSRPLGDAKPSEFYSTDGDTEVFARAVQRYVSKYDRWGSPKFILGESYGTVRAAALTYRLQKRGMSINGTILLSSVLNTGRFFSRADLNYVAFIPTFAAIAWYHERVPGGRPARLEEFIEEARRFALGPYAAALSKGQNLEPAEFDRVAQQLTRFTGLPLGFIQDAKLRITPSRFRQALLRERGTAVGELDARFVADEGDDNAAEPWFDPSYEAVGKAIYGAFMDYVKGALGYETELTYTINAEWLGELNWSYAHRTPSGAREPACDCSADLAAALRTNPYLRVLSLNGWYDLSTPFFGTEIDLSHMMLDPATQQRVTTRFYPAGHMAYMDPTVVHLLRVDIGRFIDSVQHVR
jgi:carboxypeptidase C (cathepsin A)